MSDQRELDTTADMINKPHAGEREILGMVYHRYTHASFNGYTPRDKYTFRRASREQSGQAQRTLKDAIRARANSFAVHIRFLPI